MVRLSLYSIRRYSHIDICLRTTTWSAVDWIFYRVRIWGQH